jgi:hypothetical protein
MFKLRMCQIKENNISDIWSLAGTKKYVPQIWENLKCGALNLEVQCNFIYSTEQNLVLQSVSTFYDSEKHSS